MKALHELDNMQVDELLRTDIQRVHEDEPEPTPHVQMTSIKDYLQYVFLTAGT